MAKIKTPKLLVMFDTSVLFTKIASDLLQQRVINLIRENSNHNDLIIDWYLPSIVIEERRYQMIAKAKELLPSVKKLEKLLGHSFAIGEDTLELHVNKVIDLSLKDLSIKVAPISITDVDWNEIITRSTVRKPPFEENEKEKGFRDSIIANIFFQLHKSSPSTPTICKLVLVTADNRLSEYVKEFTSHANNVRIVSTLDELENLINTLISEISEDFANELSIKANKLFFEKDNNQTFYYKNEIREKIKDKYKNELNNSPLVGYYKKIKTWWISKSVFLRKEKSTIFWTTEIKSEFELYHYEKSSTEQELDFSSSTEHSLAANLASSLLDIGKKVVDHEAYDIFYIHWKTNLSQAKNIVKPQLLNITYTGNTLSD